jgi:polyisoprenoid-binding protein YceI
MSTYAPARMGLPVRSVRVPGRRRWLRWLVIGLAAFIAVTVVAIGAFIKSQPTATPLALPAGAGRPPVGILNGKWAVGPGSQAGFRVEESALGFSNDVVGRTRAVSGTAVISGGRLINAVVRVNLDSILVGGKQQQQLARSLNAEAHPIAVVTLTTPLMLSKPFAVGQSARLTASALLDVNGITRPVTIALTARRDGSDLEAAGSIPVSFARWHISGPAGFGLLGSLANRGIAEFFLVLRRP